VGVAAIEFACSTTDLPYLQGPAPVLRAAELAGFHLGGRVGYGMDSVRWRNLGASAFFFAAEFAERSSRGSGV